jgi:hypothetical protein
MADMRITSRLKVYMTRIGVRDWLVAASSQKEALKAWDIDRNLFASGDARVTSDPTHVQIAMRNPGIPVAAPGRVVAPEEKSNVVQFTGKRVAREVKGEVDEKPVKHEKAGKRAKSKKDNSAQLSLPIPKKVDRSKLEAAERELKEFEREATRDKAEIEKRKRAIDLELEAFDAESERKRERLEKRVKREREALDE